MAFTFIGIAVLGQQVYRAVILSYKATVDLSGLLPGVYAFPLIKSDGSKKVVRLVKE
jgi:hypothetical protein